MWTVKIRSVVCSAVVASLLASCGGDSFTVDWQESTIRYGDPFDPLPPRLPPPRPPRPPQPPPPPSHDVSSIEDVPLWRIELLTKTANRDHANTDDRIRLRMKLRSGGTVDLDLQGDDRERGRIDSYSIDPWGVQRVRDIERIELYTDGSDGWCVEWIALRINGDISPIYEKTYSNCRWIDTDSSSSVVIPSITLRAHSKWNLAQHPKALQPPTQIPRHTLERMIEGAVGDALGELRYIGWGSKFGRSHVEVSRGAAQTTEVDLDLDDDNGVFRAIEVDADFSINWSCRDGHIDFELSDLRTEIEDGWVTYHKARIMRRVEDMLLRLQRMTRGGRYRCQSAPVVRFDGGIVTGLKPQQSLSYQASRQFQRQAILWQASTASSIEELPLWDLELETETGTVGDANTDDPLELRLDDSGERYRLEHVGDDRERGDVHRYHVVLPSLRRVSDITQLDLRLPLRRDDGWCVKRIALFANGDSTPIFERRFASCIWVDTDGTDQTPLTIDSATLRSDPRWQLDGHGSGMRYPASLLSPSMLKDRLEHVMGHTLSGLGKTWEDCANRRCIHVDRGSGRAFAASLDYKHDIPWNGDHHYRIDFDLAFRCRGGSLEVSLRNFSDATSSRGGGASSVTWKT